MIDSRVTADAGSIIVTGVAVIGENYASLRYYFCVGSRRAVGVAYVIISQEKTLWASSTVVGRDTGGTV